MDIVRPFAGPLFRSYRGLTEVPELAPSVLDSETRQGVDFCRSMMRLNNLQQYRTVRYLPLDDGGYGALHVAVTPGQFGQVMVRSWLEVARKPVMVPVEEEKKKEKVEFFGLFFRYNLERNLRQVLQYDGNGKYAVVEAPATIQFEFGEDGSDVSYWTGNKTDEVAVLIDNRLYGANGVLIRELSGDGEYRYAFMAIGQYCLVRHDYTEGTLVFSRLVGDGEEHLYSMSLEEASVKEVNASATQILLKMMGDKPFATLQIDEDGKIGDFSYCSAEKIDREDITPRTTVNTDRTTILIDNSPTYYRRTEPSGTSTTTEAATTYSYSVIDAWFSGDELQQATLESYSDSSDETFHFHSEYTTIREIGYGTTPCGDYMNRTYTLQYFGGDYETRTRSSNAESEYVYPGITFSKVSTDTSSAYEKFLGVQYDEYEETWEFTCGSWIYSIPLWVLVKNEIIKSIHEEDNLLKSSSDTSISQSVYGADSGGLFSDRIYRTARAPKFGLFIYGTYTENGTASCENSMEWDHNPVNFVPCWEDGIGDWDITRTPATLAICKNEQSLFELPGVAYADEVVSVTNTDAWVSLMGLYPVEGEDYVYRSFVYYDNKITEISDLMVVFDFYENDYLLPLRALTSEAFVPNPE